MGALLTPSQTVGPFHHIELPYGDGNLVDPEISGARHVVGRVVDGDAQPVDDALIEVWQADPSGRYHHAVDDRDLPLREGFTGFGRVATDADGAFGFWTLTPGPVPGPDGTTQAPHLLVSVFARGLLDRLVTRMYFPEHTEAHGRDPVLALVDDADRRATLVARHQDGVLRFDIHLQGEQETVFFAV